MMLHNLLMHDLPSGGYIEVLGMQPSSCTLKQCHTQCRLPHKRLMW